MKNKTIIYLIILVVLSLGIIVPTLSFFNKTLTGENNTFTTGEWVPAQTSFVLNHNQSEYSNLENITSYIDESGEHFQVNVEENKDQFFSFSYKITSQESAELFDFPALNVLIGDVDILQVLPTVFEDLWHFVSIDLSLLELENGVHDLSFLTNNTYDDLHSPNLEIKEVTTRNLFVKPGDKLNFYPNKTVASLFVEYKVWDDTQEVTIQEDLIPLDINDDPNLETGQYFEFTIPDNFINTELSYWSVDLFENIEETNFIAVQISTSLGISNFQSNYHLESEDELNIQTSYENLNNISKFYLAKISSNQIINEEDWDQATSLEQKQHQEFINNSLQSSYDVGMVKNNLVFINMPQNPNYLTLKLCNTHFVCEDVVDSLLIE